MANYFFVCALIALDILGGQIQFSLQNPTILRRQIRQSDDNIDLEDKYGDPFAQRRPPFRPNWQGNAWERPNFNQQGNRPAPPNNLQPDNVNRFPPNNPRTTSAPPMTVNTQATSTVAATPDPTCISSCLATPQYNPVCGSNNVTYQNEGRLMCASTCGADVTFLRFGNCEQASARS